MKDREGLGTGEGLGTWGMGKGCGQRMREMKHKTVPEARAVLDSGIKEL